MFYIVMATVNPGITIDDVQRALAGMQWYRIAPNVWVVYSWMRADDLFNRLHYLTNPGGSLLISRLDWTDRQGFMPPAFWNWARALGAPV